MATPLCYSIFSEGTNDTPNAQTLSVAAGASSTPIKIGKNHLFRVVSSAAVNIRFGDADLAEASANDVQIVPNFPEVFDMGSNKDYIVIFNSGDAAATVNIAVVARS